MVRLAIALLHTVLAAGTTTAGLFLFGQARANATWEHGFYGGMSDGTAALTFSAVVALLFGLVHGTGAWAWFAGARWGGWAVVGASVLLASGAPWTVVLLLSGSAVLVTLDLMVERHREALRDAPPTR